MPLAFPKPEARVRVKARTAQRDTRQLEAFKRAVWKRDGVRCRNCARHVTKGIDALHRGEVHHLERRATKVVRYDRRNGVLLCVFCHSDLTRGDLTIEAMGSFQVKGRSYADADQELVFIRGSEGRDADVE